LYFYRYRCDGTGGKESAADAVACLSLNSTQLSIQHSVHKKTEL